MHFQYPDPSIPKVFLCKFKVSIWKHNRVNHIWIDLTRCIKVHSYFCELFVGFYLCNFNAMSKFILLVVQHVKFIYSEKATKLWKKSHNFAWCYLPSSRKQKQDSENQVFGGATNRDMSLNEMCLYSKSCKFWIIKSQLLAWPTL